MKRAIPYILLIATAGGAAALRLPALGLRPMHTDEAVHAEKLRALMERGEYKYDPQEYHGPTLNYFTLPAVWLAGSPAYPQLRERHLRVVPAAFGVATVLLIGLLARGLGGAAAAAAAVPMALSPAMVFYGRYYIMEVLLVFFGLVAIAAGWRWLTSGRIGWAVLMGAAVGLMHATKETWVLMGFAAAVAAAIVWVVRRRTDTGDRIPDTGDRRRNGDRIPGTGDRGTGTVGRRCAIAIGVALASAVGVSVLLFSSMGTNWRGVGDSLWTYVHNFSRAGGGEGAEAGNLHVQPWHYYLGLLTWVRHGQGPLWTQAAIVLLAAVGAVAAFTRRGLGGGDPRLGRFLAVYSLVLLAAYSAIPYKTPWCVLGPLGGMILLAGMGAAALVRWMPCRWSKALAVVLLAAAAGHLGWQAQRASFEPRYVASNYNPYVYAQTLRGAVELGRRVEQIAAACPAGAAGTIVKVVTDDRHDFWPLPWYLRALPAANVGYFDDPCDARIGGAGGGAAAPAVWVITAGAWEKLRPGLQAELTDERAYRISHYGLRPDVTLLAFTRRDLWERFLQRAREEKQMTEQARDANGELRRFRRRAMGGTFEIRIGGMDEQAASQAAEAALAELERLEKSLSRFEAYSDVGQINAAAVGRPVRLGLDASACLAVSQRMWQLTAGAFDVTASGAGEAGLEVGMGKLEIDANEHTAVRRGNVRVDLGGIGKGYALDVMGSTLREWGVTCALLDGGASTVLAIGEPGASEAWRVAMRDATNEQGPAVGHVLLRAGMAFSGSSTYHKRHIVDPRTGKPVGERAAWSVAASAAEADALSTAFCVLRREEIAAVCKARADVTAILPGNPLAEIGRPALERKRQ